MKSINFILSVKYPNHVQKKEIRHLFRGWIHYGKIEFKRATGQNLRTKLVYGTKNPKIS